MRAIIVEDEIHNSRMLKGMILQLRPEWEICGTFESVKSTVAWLQQNMAPDVIFMDIQLTDGLCFSIFDQIQVSSMVIFTTAYDEYAVQAFQVNSIEYLLKPIKETKLESAIQKFERFKISKENIGSSKINYGELIDAIKNEEKKYRKRFLVTGSKALFKVDAERIAYFYTENRITYAVTFENNEHILDHTMEKLEDQLNPEQFFRANRSMIINAESVRKIENFFGGKLIVKLIKPFKDSVTISRLKASAFKEWLDK